MSSILKIHPPKRVLLITKNFYGNVNDEGGKKPTRNLSFWFQVVVWAISSGPSKKKLVQPPQIWNFTSRSHSHSATGDLVGLSIIVRRSKISHEAMLKRICDFCWNGRFWVILTIFSKILQNEIDWPLSVEALHGLSKAHTCSLDSLSLARGRTHSRPRSQSCSFSLGGCVPTVASPLWESLKVYNGKLLPFIAVGGLPLLAFLQKCTCLPAVHTPYIVSWLHLQATFPTEVQSTI